MGDIKVVADKAPAVVLAAGRGKRMMHPELPKVMVEFRGRPMIEYVVEAIERSGVCLKPIVVVGYRQEKIRDLLGDRVFYVAQEEQLGTGHAVATARPLLQGESKEVMIFYGDNPCVRPRRIAAMLDEHRAVPSTVTLAVTTVPNFQGWRASIERSGRIVRSPTGDITDIVEFANADPSLRKQRELNAMMYCFDAPWLWQNIGALENKNAQREYLLTDIVKIALSQGRKISSITLPPEECVGINSQGDLQLLESCSGSSYNLPAYRQGRQPTT